MAMRTLLPALTALFLVTTPVAAQDFFGSFEDFVEELLPQRQAPERPRPAPVPAAPDPADEAGAEDADPPPMPRPRPVGLGEDGDAAEMPEDEPNPPPPVAEPPPPIPDPPGEALDDADAGVDGDIPLPQERPDVSPEPPASPAAEEAEAEPAAPSGPTAVPGRIYQTACPALLSGTVVGEMVAPIAEGICGERSPLVITAVRVNGHEIGFSSPVTTNCAMAGALADWVGEVDAYANAVLDSPVASLGTGTSMMCRNRYSAADGFVSEHGFANALDVVGFTLADGSSINVESDWLPAAAPEGRLLRQAHGAACGRFTTVLGPEANADHEDHFHVDLGCHGQTCTAQICE
ncbi:MAG: extensin family protein [Devosia sp.]|uniref:extensin-like domain-containing protein n=1 Tax=Devosia sp. TaxID=1871048 RepID=UPI0024C9254B|nr:extensin family protein [Devosia sp.]UYN99210.1 MAG: extensin family protein [Devosia sp.]